jgi:hypothetical protein
MVEFGMAMRLSDEDKKLIEPVMEPIDKAIIWTNDYWSFDREYHESITNGRRLTNVVEVVRQIENISIDEAKAAVRQLLVNQEQQYLERKSAIYAQNPSIPSHLRKWIEVVGITVAGTHFWASCSPRHHAWRNNSRNGLEPANHVAAPTLITSSDNLNSSKGSEEQMRDSDHGTRTQMCPAIEQEVMQLNAKLSLGKQDSGHAMRVALALLSRAAAQCENLFNGIEHERARLLQPDEAKARLSWEVCSAFYSLHILVAFLIKRYRVAAKGARS